MSRGLGRVFRPVNGKGEVSAIWWLDYTVGGKRHRESSEFTRKQDAQDLLRNRIGDRQAGKLVGRPDKVTLNDLRDGLERHYSRENLRSWESAKYAFTHLERLLGPETPASELTTARVNWYVDTRLHETFQRGKKSKPRPVSRATVRMEVLILNSAFTVAVVEDQVLTSKPLFAAPTVRNARSGFFERGDVAALTVEMPALHASIIQFAFFTGWRSGEILGLTWDQVNWESKTLRIDPPTETKRTKGEDARTIPFADTPLETLLKDRWDVRDGIFVFQKKGQRLFSFRKVWERACQRAGLVGRRFHDFRRSAARELVNAGVPEKVAMQIVGWKTRAMFDRYHIVNEADVAAALKKRERYGKTTARFSGSAQKSAA